MLQMIAHPRDHAVEANFEHISRNWPMRRVEGVFAGAAGGVVLLGGTNDWTFARTAVGTYVVTFNPPFLTAAVFPVCQLYQAAGVTDVTVINSNNFTVLTFNLAGGAMDPTGVIFHADGPGPN